MDVASISGAIQSLAAARDITKALLGMKVTAEVELKVAEIRELLISAQESALDAQSERSALMQRIHDLESQLAEYDEWEEESAKYELAEVSPSVFVYALKGDADQSPHHFLCPRCFEDKTKSILLRSGYVNEGTEPLSCPRCELKIYVERGGGGRKDDIVWAI